MLFDVLLKYVSDLPTYFYSMHLQKLFFYVFYHTFIFWVFIFLQLSFKHSCITFDKQLVVIMSIKFVLIFIETFYMAKLIGILLLHHEHFCLTLFYSKATM